MIPIIIMAIVVSSIPRLLKNHNTDLSNQIMANIIAKAKPNKPKKINPKTKLSGINKYLICILSGATANADILLYFVR